VTADTIQDNFSRFGCPVVNVLFEESHISNQSKVQSGRGLIFYPNNVQGIRAAKEVAEVMKYFVIDQVIYNCHLTPDEMRVINRTPAVGRSTVSRSSCIPPRRPSTSVAASLRQVASLSVPSFHTKNQLANHSEGYCYPLTTSFASTFSSSPVSSLPSSPFSTYSYGARFSASSFDASPSIDDKHLLFV
jgi:hypothetical protein